MDQDNNYRKTEASSTCLWCRFSEIKNPEIICKKTGQKVEKDHTCDLWRYCAA